MRKRVSLSTDEQEGSTVYEWGRGFHRLWMRKTVPLSINDECSTVYEWGRRLHWNKKGSAVYRWKKKKKGNVKWAHFSFQEITRSIPGNRQGNENTARPRENYWVTAHQPCRGRGGRGATCWRGSRIPTCPPGLQLAWCAIWSASSGSAAWGSPGPAPRLQPQQCRDISSWQLSTTGHSQPLYLHSVSSWLFISTGHSQPLYLHSVSSWLFISTGHSYCIFTVSALSSSSVLGTATVSSQCQLLAVHQHWVQPLYLHSVSSWLYISTGSHSHCIFTVSALGCTSALGTATVSSKYQLLAVHQYPLQSVSLPQILVTATSGLWLPALFQVQHTSFILLLTVLFCS